MIAMPILAMALLAGLTTEELELPLDEGSSGGPPACQDKKIEDCGPAVLSWLKTTGSVGVVFVCNTCDETRGQDRAGNLLFRVHQLSDGGPGQKAGFKLGDLVYRVDGREFGPGEQLDFRLYHEDLELGKLVEYHLTRGAESIEIEVATGPKSDELVRYHLWQILMRRYGDPEATAFVEGLLGR